MISRFLLNLRQVGANISDGSIHMSRLPTIALPESRIIGNLGEDLRDINLNWDYSEPSEAESVWDAYNSQVPELQGGSGLVDVSDRL